MLSKQQCYFVVRTIIVALLSMAAVLLVVRSAFVTRFVDERPALAYRAWPTHPRVALATSMAEIGQSAALGKPASSQTIARVMDAAVRAPLAVEPFLIMGAGAVAEGQFAHAARLFVEAKRRQPRSPAARYFLAEHYLISGREMEGLTETAVLSRLVSGGVTAVVPSIAQYATLPSTLPNVQRLFRANHDLRSEVLAYLARDADNAELVLALADGDVGRIKSSSADDWRPVLLKALIDRGDIKRAFSSWKRINGLRNVTSGLFNPQFNQKASGPFNWTFYSGDFGVAEPFPPAGLQIIYYGRADGALASQMLRLSPGDYEMRMRITRQSGPIEQSGVSWSLACQTGGRELLRLPFKSGIRSPTHLVARFAVPGRCPFQLLVLKGTARDTSSYEEVVVSELGLKGPR